MYAATKEEPCDIACTEGWNRGEEYGLLAVGPVENVVVVLLRKGGGFIRAFYARSISNLTSKDT